MQFDWDEIAWRNLQLYAETDRPLHSALMTELARLRAGDVVGIPVQRQQGTGYVVLVHVSGRDTEHMLVWIESSPGLRLIAYCGPRLPGT